MAEEVTIVIDVDDQGTPQIEQVSGAMDDFDESATSAGEGAEQMGGGVETAGASADDMSGSVGKMAGPLVAAAAAMKGAQIAADLLASAVGAAVEFSEEAVEAWQVQHTALRNLRQAYSASGQAGDQLAGTMDELSEVSSDFADRTLFGNEAIEEALAQYQRLTPEVIDASDAQEDLNTILGMAEIQGMSAAGAAERFAQAQSGKVRGLERVTSMTRDQVRELGQIEDASERAEIATQALRDEYEDAAEDVDGLALAQSNLENAQDDVLKTWGELVSESDGVIAAVEHMEGMFQELDRWINENEEALTILVEEGFFLFVASVEHTTDLMIDMGHAFGVINSEAENVEDAMMSLTGTVGRFGDAIQTAGSVAQFVPGWIALAPGIRGVGRSLSAVGERGQELRDNNGAAEAFQDIMDGAEELQEVLDALEESADHVASGFGEAWEQFKEGGNLEDIIGEDLEEISAQRETEIQQINRQLALTEDMSEEERVRLERRKNLLGFQERQAEIRQDHEEGQERQAALYDAETDFLRRQKELNEDIQQHEQDREDAIEERVDAQMAEIEALGDLFEHIDAANDEYDHRNEIAGIQLEQLDLQRQAVGEIDQIELARLQKEEAMAQLRQDDDLTDQEREVERQRILLDFEEKRTEAIRKRRQQEKMAAEEEARQTQAQLRGINQHISGLGTLASSMHELQEEGWDFAEANEAATSALAAAAQVGGQAADMLTETREQQAAVEGTFHTAAAVANTALALSTGNPQYTGAAIQHGVAATQFFAVAGGVGGSARGSGGGGGGTSPQATGDIEFDDDDAGGDVIYEIDFSGATTLEDSQSTGRRIRDATESADRDQYRVGGR